MPTPIDYPDYLRVAQSVGPPLIETRGELLSGGQKDYGTFNVATWDSLVFSASGAITAGEYVVINLLYYSDQAALHLLGSQQMQCRSNSAIQCAVSPLGPWVNISVTWGTTGVLHSTNLLVMPRLVPHGWARSIGDSRVLKLNALAVGAGATVDTLIGTVTSGRAHLHVHTGGTLWTATLQTLDTTDAVDSALAQCYQTAAFYQGDVEVILPPVQCRLRIVNFDGAGRTYDGSLTVDTSW